MTRVLVIGAGGVFGSRLAEGLLRNRFAVFLAGRDSARAEAVARRLRAMFPDAEIATARIDTATVTPADLTTTGATIVADAAGPFQGAQPTAARAAIAAGLSYVDLADGRDFVAAFSVLDKAAKGAGVVALTGCSSTPALSRAVLDHLTADWREVVSVEAAISPGAKAPRGLSVMRAILSWLDGRCGCSPTEAGPSGADGAGFIAGTSGGRDGDGSAFARHRIWTCCLRGSVQGTGRCFWRDWSLGLHI